MNNFFLSIKAYLSVFVSLLEIKLIQKKQVEKFWLEEDEELTMIEDYYW